METNHYTINLHGNQVSRFTLQTPNIPNIQVSASIPSDAVNTVSKDHLLNLHDIPHHI